MSLILDPDNPPPNLRMIVAAEVTNHLLTVLGIDLPLERRVRIAEEMDYWVKLGAGGALAFSQALWIEFLLYGNPTEEGEPEPVGILNNPPLRRKDARK